MVGGGRFGNRGVALDWISLYLIIIALLVDVNESYLSLGVSHGGLKIRLEYGSEIVTIITTVMYEISIDEKMEFNMVVNWNNKYDAE